MPDQCFARQPQVHPSPKSPRSEKSESNGVWRRIKERGADQWCNRGNRCIGRPSFWVNTDARQQKPDNPHSWNVEPRTVVSNDARVGSAAVVSKSLERQEPRDTGGRLRCAHENSDGRGTDPTPLPQDQIVDG